MKKDKIHETDNFDSVAEFPHPSGKGLLVILHNTNWEVEGPPYFLVFSTDNDRPYICENSRICRIYVNKPEYLVGYNENCKLTKKEKELFIRAMLENNEWEEQVITESEWYDFWHMPFKKVTMPNYTLLEEE